MSIWYPLKAIYYAPFRFVSPFPKHHPSRNITKMLSMRWALSQIHDDPEGGLQFLLVIFLENLVYRIPASVATWTLLAHAVNYNLTARQRSQ